MARKEGEKEKGRERKRRKRWTGPEQPLEHLNWREEKNTERDRMRLEGLRKSGLSLFLHLTGGEAHIGGERGDCRGEAKEERERDSKIQAEREGKRKCSILYRGSIFAALWSQ